MKKLINKRDFHCDLFTFGNSRAAIMLSQLLNDYDDPKLCAKVSKTFHGSCTVFRELLILPHFEFHAKLYYKHVVDCININNWPIGIKTLTKNCITTQLKKHIREIDSY